MLTNLFIKLDSLFHKIYLKGSYKNSIHREMFTSAVFCYTILFCGMNQGVRFDHINLSCGWVRSWLFSYTYCNVPFGFPILFNVSFASFLLALPSVFYKKKAIHFLFFCNRFHWVDRLMFFFPSSLYDYFVLFTAQVWEGSPWQSPAIHDDNWFQVTYSKS